jgi:phage portal protein BeeE
MEQRLDEGLELPNGDFEVAADLDSLLRMDPQSRYTAHSEAIRGGWKAPNEARKAEDLLPAEGGNSPMMQQQNYSLAALAKRDASNDPFGTATKTEAPPAIAPPEQTSAGELELREFLMHIERGLAREIAAA